MHLSILMCFLSVGGLCSAFFLSKDNGKPFLLCHKICPLYCPKNRRQDDDTSFLVYSDDQSGDTIDYDFKTKIPSRFFLHCKPKRTTTTPSPTTKSTVTPSTTTTSTTTPKPTTTTSSTTMLTTTTSSTTTSPTTTSTTTPASTTKSMTLLADTENRSFDFDQDYDSSSKEDSLARDYNTQAPVRFFVDCRWKLKVPSTDDSSTTTNKPTTNKNRRYDDDASSHIYVDHHSPYYIDEESPPHKYEIVPPRRFYAHKKKTTTPKPTTTPAPTTTEDPSSHIYVDHDTPYYIDEDMLPHDYEVVPPRFYVHKKWPTTAKPTTTTAAPTTTTEEAPHFYSDHGSPYYIPEDLPYHDYEIITPYFYVHKKWTTAKPTTTAAPTTTEEPTFICELCNSKC